MYLSACNETNQIKLKDSNDLYVVPVYLYTQSLDAIETDAATILFCGKDLSPVFATRNW